MTINLFSLRLCTNTPRMAASIRTNLRDKHCTSPTSGLPGAQRTQGDRVFQEEVVVLLHLLCKRVLNSKSGRSYPGDYTGRELVVESGVVV